MDSWLTSGALQNADALLYDVLKLVDANGDGHIEYNGTRNAALNFRASADYSQNSVPLSSMPSKSYGGYFRASIESTMANWTRQSYN